MKNDTFYVMAIPQGESFMILSDPMTDELMTAETIEEARRLKEEQDSPEGITILKCEVIK